MVQLFKCSTWFLNGTFKTAPALFFQIFSILGAVTQVGINRKSQTVGLPLVHALLENKKEATYLQVFNVIMQKADEYGLDGEPEHVMTDFELAIINAA